MSFRILIAEGHTALRAGLRALLETEPDLEVVGEATNTREMLLRAGELRPDVVLLDIDLPDLQGFDAIRRLSEALCNTKLLLLTHYLDAGLVRDALVAGAAGCVASQAAAAALAVAVRAVSQGQLYMGQYAIRALLADLIEQAAPSELGALTPREVDVLRLVAQGCTNREVAEALALSIRAVESDRATAMEKLGLHSRAALVRYAIKCGLVGPPASGPRHP